MHNILKYNKTSVYGCGSIVARLRLFFQFSLVKYCMYVRICMCLHEDLGDIYDICVFSFNERSCNEWKQSQSSYLLLFLTYSGVGLKPCLV